MQRRRYYGIFHSSAFGLRRDFFLPGRSLMVRPKKACGD
jgi:hypothetical protein